MKIEARIFLILTPFFILVALGYGWWSRWNEPVGLAALLLVGGLVGMIGGYLALLSRRIDPRPEDDPYGEIEHGAGEQGVFSPGSWWPLVTAAGAAISFLALAVGWWLLILGFAVGAFGLIGWMFENSRGQHAH